MKRMPDRLPAALSLTLLALLISPSAHAQQTPLTPPGPAPQPAVKAPVDLIDDRAKKADAKGAAKSNTGGKQQARTVTLAPERPGAYSYWVVSGSGQGTIASLTAMDRTASVTLPGDAKEIQVLDETNDTLAVFPADRMKNGATVAVAPGDFKRLRNVVVNVTSGGKPVEKAVVSLTDASGKAQQQALTAAEEGKAVFDNILIGKATVMAAYGAGSAARVTQETALAPAKGGESVTVEVALSGNVPTVETKTEPAVAAATPQTEHHEDAAASSSNSWIAGVVGLALLAGLAYFGLRYARNRNMTVPGMLKQIGVEMPQDAQETPISHLKPPPASASLPPLPSLAEQPAAGPAPAAAVAATAPVVAGAAATAAARTDTPRLVGVGGAVSGESFPLTASAGPLTVGRDAGNSLALTQDTTISRRHARFEPEGGGWVVVDEGSSNGTFVNGMRVSGRQPLRPGDEIQVGASRLRFEG